MPFRLLVFGPPQLTDDEAKTFLGIGPSRAMALLIFLRVRHEGLPVDRAHLPGRLWIERNSDAFQVTRNAVSTLRKTLGQAVDANGTITLAASRDLITTDLDDLGRLIGYPAPNAPLLADKPELTPAKHTRASADAVLGFYRGAFLEGWTPEELKPPRAGKAGIRGYADDFVRWVSEARIAWELHVQTFLSDIVRALGTEGDWEGAQSVLRKLYAVVPDVRRAMPELWVTELQVAIALRDAVACESVRRGFLRSEAEIPADVRAEFEVISHQPLFTQLLRGRVPALPGEHSGSSSRVEADVADVSGFHESPSPTPREHAEGRDSASASSGSRRDRDEERPAPAVRRLARSGRRRWPVAAGATVVTCLTIAVLWGAHGGSTHGTQAATFGACSAADARITLVRHNYQLNRVFTRPRQQFTKGWWLLNDSPCVFGPGLRLHFLHDSGGSLSSTRPDGHRDDIALVQHAEPHQELLVEVPMHAPEREGTALERWAIIDGEGHAVQVNGSDDALLAQVRLVVNSKPCKAGEASALFVGASHSSNQALVTGRPFLGTWTLLNDGACEWPTGMSLTRTGEPVLSGGPASLATDRPVRIGEVYTFRVDMRVPELPGHYGESWQFADVQHHPISVGGETGVSIRVASVMAGEMASQTEVPACGRGQTRAGWVGESPEDFAVIKAGASFRKTWTLSNTGSCRWQGFYLRFRNASQLRMSGADEVGVTNAVAPGATYSFDVPMRAPISPGVFRETWYVRDAFGDPVLATRTDTVWVIIKVPAVQSNADERKSVGPRGVISRRP